MASHRCPSQVELRGLLDGKLTPPEQTAFTDHLGACTGCQSQLDNLATEGDGAFEASLREVRQADPPSNSAFWSALKEAEIEISRTGLYVGVGPSAPTPHPFGDLKLDFLKPPSGPDRLGQLGDFDILRVVGRGGMGVVLHGFDPCLHRDIAIKVLDPQLAHTDTARQRFCREARAAAAVTHDNLVAVHQVAEDEPSGLPYLIMQLVNGESLEQRLKRVGKLGVPEVARLGMQAAAGLAAAHAGGLIHRDIKPGNILLEEGSDRVKLTDFGLARAAEDVKLTRSGFVAGTPLYMAPEQARGEDVDARADLFSLGSVLYETVTGHPPFEGKTALAVLRRVADEAHTPVQEVDPDAPEWLSDIIDRLLEKNPDDRFQTSAEVAETFAAELARMHTLSPLDVPAEVCPLSRSTGTRRVRGRKVAWGCVAKRAAPLAAGVLIGALAVGLAGYFTRPAEVVVAPPTPAPEPGPAPRAVLNGNGGSVWALAFAPDGNTLVTGSEDGVVKVWDVNKQTVRREVALDANVWAVDVSADGKHLLTAADNSEVKVWTLADYKAAQTLLHPTTGVKSAVFSHDGKKVATGDRGSMIRVWDWVTGKQKDLQGRSGTVNALAFSPDARTILAGWGDGAVNLWDVESGMLNPDPIARTGPVYAVAFGPTGERYASGGSDGVVRVWNTKNEEVVHALKGHTDDVWSLSFNADGSRLASAGGDGTVRVWDTESGREVVLFRGGGRALHSVRFAKSGNTLAAGGRDGTVRVWDVPGK